jgi:hypothetical protein
MPGDRFPVLVRGEGPCGWFAELSLALEVAGGGASV